MKFSTLFGLFLAVVLVVESLPDEDFFEDEDFQDDARHHLKACKSQKDCNSNECCQRSSIFVKKKCKPLRKEGESCFWERVLCHHKCEAGLKCQRVQGSLLKKQCMQAPTSPPTEESGSGDFEV
ncbi:uncharacterized protein [Montipora capricornis]|uniref:uncharacterized protein n=1 Tax=Montipora capricornis TaxID=246305 RepID=UPI0035F1DAD8